MDWTTKSALLSLTELLDNFLKFNPKFELTSHGNFESVLNPRLLILKLDIEWLEISPSGAFFVKTYCRHYSKDDARVEALIPNVSFWTDLILKQVILCSEGELDETQVQEAEFVIAQMLQTTKYLDLSDEAGRRRLVSLLEALLSETAVNAEIVEYAVVLLEEISNCSADFLGSMTSVLKQISGISEETTETEALLSTFKCLEIIQFLLQYSNQVGEDYCFFLNPIADYSLLNFVDEGKPQYFVANGAVCFSWPRISY